VPDALPLTDRVLVGRYRTTRLIARGGMAEVWEAYDDVLARPVAVKILHPHLAVDDAFVTRFRLEAQAAARLAHPGIVATFDTGTDGDLAFIVMELVPGHTLRDAVEKNGTLPPSVAVPIAAEIADALDHAHREGLIHRDVKPANILLVEQEGGTTAPLLRVKVADFGIAKLQPGANATVANLTQTGAVVGTARYLAPEQVQGRPPDARSDVYALGVVLYEMLCGKPPFAAETELGTALLHVREPPPALRCQGPPIPASLEAIVMRALAKDPDDRFPSAAALRDALVAEDLDLEPDDAVPQVVRETTPASGVPVMARPASRRLLPLAVVAAIAVAAILLVAVLAGRDTGGGTGGTEKAAAGSGGASIAAAHSFDPAGDGEENENRAARVIDGDTGTSWNTDRYRREGFGGLKPGVGLVLQLADAAELAALQVTSPTSGWSAAVYVAERPAADLGGWGRPVAEESDISGDAEFDLGGRPGGAVLLWITDPGTDNRAEVAEMTLRRS